MAEPEQLIIWLGNTNPVNTYHEEIDHRDYSAEELKAMATERGLDAMGTKELIAGRLSGELRFKAQHERPAITRVEPPLSMSVMETVNEILRPVRGVWAVWSGLEPGPEGTDEVVNTPPSWVWSTSDLAAQILSDHFGCPIGVPEDLEETHYTVSGPPGVGPKGPIETANKKKGSKK